MDPEAHVQNALSYLISRTSRRGVLAGVGKALVGAGLLTVGIHQQAEASAGPQPLQPSCANCGGCSCGPGCNQSCGTEGGNCCPNCAACASSWCYGPGSTQGGCPVPTIYGWWWWCCKNHEIWTCQDCCDPNTYACVCSTRTNEGHYYCN